MVTVILAGASGRQLIKSVSNVGVVLSFLEGSLYLVAQRFQEVLQWSTFAGLDENLGLHAGNQAKPFQPLQLALGEGDPDREV